MSLSEMRTELKKLRKDIMPTPVSRMKKVDIANQIERLKPTEVKPTEVVVEKKTKAVKPTEVVVKKTKGEPKKQEVKKTKAGSVEMGTKMAALIAKRTANKSE